MRSSLGKIKPHIDLAEQVECIALCLVCCKGVGFSCQTETMVCILVPKRLHNLSDEQTQPSAPHTEI